MRMSPILTGDERSNLAWAMFEDVVEALRALSPATEVVLVTDSLRAAKRADELGWRALTESHQISESASVDGASSQIAEEGVQSVLRLPADLPLVQPEDIQELLELSLVRPAAVLVPSWDHLGTNALLRTPPDLFPSRFGHNSFVLHTQEALRAQAALEIVQNPRIALDLDDAGDIQRFMEQPSKTRTYRLLEQMRLEERLVPHAT